MAFLKGSFYKHARRFTTDDGSDPPFRGVRERELEVPEPILEHTVTLDERHDRLAHHYYADPRAWRRIADANVDALFFEDLLAPTGWIAVEGHEPVDEAKQAELGNVVLIPRRRDVG